MELSGGLEQDLGFCKDNPLLVKCKDQCKQLLLDRIELTDVPFVNTATGYLPHATCRAGSVAFHLMREWGVLSALAAPQRERLLCSDWSSVHSSTS